MHDDKRYTWFYAVAVPVHRLMLFLVIANNLVQMFVGWEGRRRLLLLPDRALLGGERELVGGDQGVHHHPGRRRRLPVRDLRPLHARRAPSTSLELNELAEHGEIGGTFLTIGALLLFMGAVGKSAQFPLHVWLPDAMAGPTPVSALIHAATMVVAGIYLVARMFLLFEHAGAALDVVAIIAAITMLIAALLALVQDDIKKVLAYSTISQLGYMMAALGVGAYTAGVFHLFTHAMLQGVCCSWGPGR